LPIFALSPLGMILFTISHPNCNRCARRIRLNHEHVSMPQMQSFIRIGQVTQMMNGGYGLRLHRAQRFFLVEHATPSHPSSP
jgi:hypothetical protein